MCSTTPFPFGKSCCQAEEPLGEVVSKLKRRCWEEIWVVRRRNSSKIRRRRQSVLPGTLRVWYVQALSRTARLEQFRVMQNKNGNVVARYLHWVLGAVGCHGE